MNIPNSLNSIEIKGYCVIIYDELSNPLDSIEFSSKPLGLRISQNTVRIIFRDSTPTVVKEIFNAERFI